MPPGPSPSNSSKAFLCKYRCVIGPHPKNGRIGITVDEDPDHVPLETETIEDVRSCFNIERQIDCIPFNGSEGDVNPGQNIEHGMCLRTGAGVILRFGKVKEGGGMLHMSNETKKTLRKHRSSALVVGVFAAGRVSAYVSLRIVDVNSRNIISSTDFSVPMGPDARVLLKLKQTGDAIPGK